MPETGERRIPVSDETANATTEGEPVLDFPIRFRWHTGPWEAIFDEQIKLIQEDVARARAEGRLVVYLSCPISERGGGWSGTNVDIAKHTERVLLGRWGEAFWILNPAQYQLESKAGTGLIERHAERLEIDLVRLRSFAPASGGDYMRMWTRVLVENGVGEGGDSRLKNAGTHFDAYYFLGPRDVHNFFRADERTLTEGIQSYFARKYAMDPDFCDRYEKQDGDASRQAWVSQRLAFLRYYGLRASANFSLGCHDEWSIFRLLNERRRAITQSDGALDGDVGEQMAGFFDGGQLDPASTEAPLTRGYAR